MEVILCNPTQACRWPAYKGPFGLRAFSHETARRRRRASLTRSGYRVQTFGSTLNEFGARHGRLSTSGAAAAPATPGGSGAQSSRNVPSPSSQPQQPSSPPQLATTQQQTQQHQQAQQPQPYNRKPRFRLLPEDPNDRQRPEDNPSLDDIVLDEQYYKEMGLTKEEVWEALRQLDATEVDPEGVNLGSSGLQAWPPSADNSGAPLRNHRTNPLNSAATSTRQEARSDHNMPQLQRQPHWIRGSVQDDGEYKSRGATDVDDELEDEGQEEEEEGQDDDEEEEEEEEGAWAEQQQRGDRLSEESTLQPPLGGPVLGLGPGSIDVEAEEEGEVYGPEAVVLAGFRPEEHGVVRALLDSAGGHVVKVLPVTEAMLYGTVDEAVQSGEQDWSAPRPLGGPRGGGWGAQRTVLFSGLSLRAQLTVLELLESSGIPAVCAAAAEEEHAGRRLGDVLTEAMVAQRSQANRLPKQEEPWRAAAAAAGRVADVRQGLTPLEDLIGPKAQERLLHLQQLADGNEDDKEVYGMYDDKVTATTTTSAAAAAAAADARAGSNNGGSGGGGGAAAAVKAPVLDSFGLEAAEAATADWEAWRASRAAAAAAGWGLDTETVDAGTALNPNPDLDPDPTARVPNLADLGVDLEQLREQVLRQLADLDPDTLDELLVDSPYGDAAGDAVAQWQQAQEQEVQGPPRTASSAAASTAAGPGLTVDDVGRLAERQRRLWQEVQGSLESAAAAEGQLVVQAESSLLPEAAAAAPPPPLLQGHRRDPPPSPDSSSGDVGTPWEQAGPPASASAAAAVAVATAASAATSAATRLGIVASGAERPSYKAPVEQKQQQQQKEAAAAASTAEQLQPRQQPPPLPPLSAFDLFGGGEASSPFSELDNLLGQLAPPSGGGSGAASARGTAGGGFGAAVPASAASAPLSSSSIGHSRQVTNFGGPAGSGGAAASAAATAASGGGVSGGGGGGGGLLQQVREAARSGTAPQEIQRMLDERYGVASPPPPPPKPDARATLPPASSPSTAAGAAEEPGGAVSKRRRGSLFAGLKSAKAPAAAGAPPPPPLPPQAPPAAARAQRRRPYGPSPPPDPDPVMKPLLELRPDIARAVQEKKVQFMDLSRLNDKQKRQFVEYQERLRLQQQVQQQEKQHLLQQVAQQQPQQRHQGLRQQEVRQQQQQIRQRRMGGGDLAGAATLLDASSQGMQLGQGMYGGRGSSDQEYDVYDAEDDVYDTEGDVEEEGESEESDEDEHEEYGASLDAEKLRELMEASHQEGLSLEDTLAQAVAMGVRLPDDVLRQAGVSAPSEEALARAREDYSRVFMQWAAEEGIKLTEGQQTMEGRSGSESGTGDESSMPRTETNRENRAVAQQQLQQQFGSIGGGTASKNGGGSSSSSGGSRPWGAGLAARRRPLRPAGPS